MALVPAADDVKLKATTQRSYDCSVRNLARTYYQVWRAISAEPGWIDAEVPYYLGAADRGTVDALGPDLDLYHDVLGTSAQNSGGHDPYHVRSATMWWLRRSHDKTATIWLEGLERLLRTYDARWLGTEQSKPPHKPPRRQHSAEPEYR